MLILQDGSPEMIQLLADTAEVFAEWCWQDYVSAIYDADWYWFRMEMLTSN